MFYVVLLQITIGIGFTSCISTLRDEGTECGSGSGSGGCAFDTGGPRNLAVTRDTCGQCHLAEEGRSNDNQHQATPNSASGSATVAEQPDRNQSLVLQGPYDTAVNIYEIFPNRA